MKTAREKAKEIIDALPFAVFCYRDHLERALAAAIIAQDRDTRHACAEAVSLLRGQMGEGGDPFCAAHAACMNVKVV